MFSLCKQTHPATAIEFAVTCYFYNKKEKCLVTAGANILKVFRIIPDVEFGTKEKYTDFRPPKMRLECLASFSLHGNVMSLQSVTLSGSQTDALLLSFRDAKLAVVQMDMNMYELRTLSLHYFEEDEVKGGWVGNQHIPVVRVDPENRCAVMLIYGNKLVVLPFQRDHVLDDMDTIDAKPLTNNHTTTSSKCTILASYMIDLKELDERIDNVIDIQFLFGYYEPTLNILYEPVKTFPGRIAVRTDTCCMAAISINIQQRVHPVIWSLAGLPYDCVQIVPVPKPIGGCMVFAVNSLIYLNQSVPPYGVSLNNIADHSTSFPLKPQDNVKMSLEGACSVFITPDKLVLSVNTGELYVLTLFADSMRTVRNFHFSKAASSVLTSCICMCWNGYLFLGSRLGNSLLLRFTEKHQNTIITLDDLDDVEPVSTKKRRIDKEDPQTFGDVDDFEVYGTETKTAMQLTSYVFEVCDSLLNIGPVGSVAPGEPVMVSEELAGPDLDVELVTTSGHGKNGALCVLQRSIKQQIVTTFTLPGVLDMWTVLTDDKSSEIEASHAFMILSHDTSTMILQTGNEINEVEETGFSTQAPTVFAGNLGNCKYIVQVTTRSIRLLQGTKLLQNVPLDLGCPVIQACVADPYLCILSEQGQVISLALRDMRGNARLVNNRNSIGASPRVITMCVYRDLSGLFSSIISEDEYTGERAFVSADRKADIKPENEDDLLYAASGNVKIPTLADMATTMPSSTHDSSWWRKHLLEIRPSYWLLLVRDNGNLEIYSMPELKLHFLIRHPAQGSKVLVDSMESVPMLLNVAMFQAESSGNTNLNYDIKEILMVGLGNHGTRPLLLIRLEHEVLIYQVYKFPKGNLKMRFRKLNHNIVLPKMDVDSANVVQHEDTYTRSKQHIRRMCYFGNIAGYNGVFISGSNPNWLFLTARGELRTHPMNSDGAVNNFAPFNNVNCPKGFVYLNRKSELRICILPTHLSYDAPWPVRKVPLRCTPHFVVYHMETRTYCVITSISQPSQSYYKFNGEDKELSEENKGERFLYPLQDKFSMCLFSPSTWEVIPNTNIDLDEWEHATCVKNVALAYEGTTSGLKGYIAIGTNYNYSEDITSRGRILIYDIIEVVPEPGQPLTKNRFKQVYSKDQKGPVTAITQVLGFLVSAVGQKIYLWQLKDNDLVGVAFIDTQIYIHQILSIKSLILVADVYKSISLLRFQEEFRTLSLVSRDYRACEVYSIEYLVDNTMLGFLVSDSEKNLVVYMYQPEARESFGGQKLLRKADYHLGQHVNAFFRIRCRNGDGVDDRKLFSGSDRRHITMFATLDGGLGYIMPLPEKFYRRMLMLQNVMVNQSQHLAGLNPKVFRTYKTSRKLNANPARNIIDGDLIASYLNLSASDKLDVAKKIGTKMEEILYDLADIDRIAAHF